MSQRMEGLLTECFWPIHNPAIQPRSHRRIEHPQWAHLSGSCSWHSTDLMRWEYRSVQSATVSTHQSHMHYIRNFLYCICRVIPCTAGNLTFKILRLQKYSNAEQSRIIIKKKIRGRKHFPALSLHQQQKSTLTLLWLSLAIESSDTNFNFLLLMHFELCNTIQTKVIVWQSKNVARSEIALPAVAAVHKFSWNAMTVREILFLLGL